MPLHYARRLTARRRSVQANQHIGFVLTFVAGATNAGAFLAVNQYTSHMTGVVSSMADHLVLGAWDLVAGGLGALLAFLFGAACTSLMVNFARRRRLHSEYAAPLLLEAGLLLAFGLLGVRLAAFDAHVVTLTVVVLCFAMGLQNALITKLSKAEIRTTHMTGIVTDIGIELGRMMYRLQTRHDRAEPIAGHGHRDRLGLLAKLLASFFCGGVAGAWAFSRIGYAATVPLAVLLALIAMMPAWDDVNVWWRRRI